MEPWDLIWDLHIDRPAVVSKVKHAFGAMLRQRYHEAVPPKGYLEALLTLLEYCGDFHIQSKILTMILYHPGVADYKDWLAPTWFRDMPNTLDSFLQLKMDDSEAAHCDFLHTYNKELDLQFLFSVRCCLVKWNDEYQLHARNGVVWLHLNCGTRTLSLTGVQSTPPEVADRTWFVLKSFELRKVVVDSLVSPCRGRLQGITILTTKGKLYVTPDPIIEDWSMFVDFIKFISKVRVEFVDLTDCNGNSAAEPSRNYYGQFNDNQNRNISRMQHLAPNAIVQVTSSQDDAWKTLAHNPGDVSARLPHNPGEVPANLPHNPGEVPANLPHNPGEVPANLPLNAGEVSANLAHNQGEAPMQMCSDSDNNDIEICHHFKRDSTNESCNDSDTADDRSDKMSILEDGYSQKTCEKEPNADINPEMVEVAETHSEPYISDKAAVGSNRFLPRDSCPDEKAPIILQSELQHCDDGEKPKTEEDSSSLELIAAAEKDLHVPELVKRTSKARKVTRRRSAAPRLVKRALKATGDTQEQTVKSDDDSSFVGTPRRETRAFTQSLKEVMPEYSIEFKTPCELPIKVQNRKRTNKKRKSEDSILNSDVESSPPNATPLVRSQSPLAEETSCESQPPKSMKLSPGDDSGIVSVEEEAPLSSNVLHPQSMPTLMTPIATPVRDFADSFIDDFSKTHEKSNEAQPTCIPPGPPPAVPLHVNPSFKMSACQDYNLRYPIKPRNLEEDITDVKSENGLGENAWETGMMDSSSDSYFDKVETAGSAVLLPDGGCPANPIRPEACPPGGMDNLNLISDLCSRVVDETC